MIDPVVTSVVSTAYAGLSATPQAVSTPSQASTGTAAITGASAVTAPLAAPQAALAAQEDKGGNPNNLTKEEQEVVNRLKKRDEEVRRHESAHASAGGPFAGVATYEYQRGPDGRLYAVGGEVKIDVTSAGSPEATIRKMETIKRAALAPADPSAQDRAVAAAAEQIKLQAEAELDDKKVEEEAERQERSQSNEAALRGERPPVSGVVDAYQQAALLTNEAAAGAASAF